MTGPNDDFTNFLEFGMPFPDLGAGQNHSSPAERQHSFPPRSVANPPASMPTSAGQDQLIRMDTDHSSASFDFHGGSSHDNSSQQAPTSLPVTYSTMAAMTPGFYTPEHPPQHHQFQNQPQMPQHHAQQPSHAPSSHYPKAPPNGQAMIPPTPNSMELHGNTARYPQRVDENHKMYDQYARMNEEQVDSLHPY